MGLDQRDGLGQVVLRVLLDEGHPDGMVQLLQALKPLLLELLPQYPFLHTPAQRLHHLQLLPCRRFSFEDVFAGSSLGARYLHGNNDLPGNQETLVRLFLLQLWSAGLLFIFTDVEQVQKGAESDLFTVLEEQLLNLKALTSLLVLRQIVTFLVVHQQALGPFLHIHFPHCLELGRLLNLPQLLQAQNEILNVVGKHFAYHKQLALLLRGNIVPDSHAHGIQIHEHLQELRLLNSFQPPFLLQNKIMLSQNKANLLIFGVYQLLSSQLFLLHHQ
mmetsp:Transcript_21833/g.36965  ORF Transcript_21833/g.36965 Transcript_21833/m.36965 type:complete len:274 (-) Transcript_21833:1178-1999(-)